MLHAWFEFIEIQTGSSRRVDLDHESLSIGRNGGDLKLVDPGVAEVHAIVTKEHGGFTIRDLGSGPGTFVNDRPILEAQLTNLDQIRIGQTILTFHAAYLSPEEFATRFAPSGAVTPSAPPASNAEPAPGHSAHRESRRPLLPPSMLAHPLRFWPQALTAGVFQFRRTWVVHALLGAILLYGALAPGDGIPSLRLAFLTFATVTGLLLTAVTCSVFFAFDTLTDAPHRLSQSLRFVFHVSPYVVGAQIAFLSWASRAHPRNDRYFLVALAPSAFYWAFFALQSRHAFGASLVRGLAFSITASVPWNLLMTGLMSFLV